MSQGTATHTSECEAIIVVFTCDWEKCDYGVSGSPVWEEPCNVEVSELVICGVEQDVSKLSPDTINQLLKLSDDLEFE